jgi:hypothetical protein
MFYLWRHRSLSVRGVAVLGDSKKSNNILANREQGPKAGSFAARDCRRAYVDAKEVCREVSAFRVMFIARESVTFRPSVLCLFDEAAMKGKYASRLKKVSPEA